MRKGICPKCNSNDVYKMTNGIHPGSGRGHIYIRTSSVTHATDAEHFICTSCGYFEAYSLDREKLNDVVLNWEKVNKA